MKQNTVTLSLTEYKRLKEAEDALNELLNNESKFMIVSSYSFENIYRPVGKDDGIKKLSDCLSRTQKELQELQNNVTRMRGFFVNREKNRVGIGYLK